MKRNQREKSAKSSAKTRPIEPDRLTGIRGGSDLGITPAGAGPIPFNAPLQHNEALVGL